MEEDKTLDDVIVDSFLDYAEAEINKLSRSLDKLSYGPYMRTKMKIDNLENDVRVYFMKNEVPEWYKERYMRKEHGTN